MRLTFLSDGVGGQDYPSFRKVWKGESTLPLFGTGWTGEATLPSF